MEKIIFLVGFMGSGKSYWGRQLATTLGYKFIDLDQRIEKGEGCSISEVFARRGEFVFRALEGSYLRILLDQEEPMIVSTGGGAPCFFDNMAFMNRNGCTVWLDVPTSILAERLLPERAHRPLLANIAPENLEPFIAERLEARREWYEQAKVHLDWVADNDDFMNRLISTLHSPTLSIPISTAH